MTVNLGPTVEKHTIMYRKPVYILFFFLSFHTANAQKDTTNDSSIYADIDYDELFTELESFLDSLTKPRSFFLINAGVGNRVFNFQSANSNRIHATQKLSFIPSLGYFDKSGIGFNLSAAALREDRKINVYQYSGTISYDYIQNPLFLTGMAYTRFITKNSLNFYTSPLQNEAYAYFAYRQWWIKPTVSAGYGWGSRTEFEEREESILGLRRRLGGGGSSRTTEESIRDFNVNLALRHDFYWLNILSKNDYIRFSPQVSFTGGTQNYGFNQTSNYAGVQRFTKNNLLFTSDNVSVNETTSFQPLSLTALLKSEFSKGKFFLQPQLMFDYYLPDAPKKFTTAFVVNTGFML